MMGVVSDIRESNRGSTLFDHLSTVSEGIAMLGWIAIEPKPVAFIGDMLASTQFYGNRVIKEYKEKLVTPRVLQVSHSDLYAGTAHMLNGYRPFTASSHPLPAT